VSIANKAQTSRTFRSLRHRNYQLFFGANLFANLGTWMQRISQDWLVLELTGSGTILGIVTGLQFAPALFLSLPAGKLADKFNKRKILVGTNLIAGSAALTLGILVVTDLVVVWHILVLAFILGIAGAVDAPVRQSFVPELVGKEDLPNAVGLNSTNFNLARLVGPAIAGVLIGAFGTGPAFFINAVTYPIVILSLVMMNRATLIKRDLSNADKSDSIRVALAYVKGRKDIVATMLLVLLIGAFGFNFQVVTALMARVEFGLGASAFGMMGTMIALGTVTGAIIVARQRTHPKIDLVFKAGAIFGITEMFASAMPTFWWFAAALPFCGLSAMIMMASANSFVQGTISDHLRGRVMGLYLMVFIGGSPFGSPIIGYIGQNLGARWALFTGGAICLVSVIALFLIFRKSIQPAALAN
jgi:MFS family permease